MELKRLTLIVVCGWPASGKTTIAKALSGNLGIRHLDIDDNIRYPLFGPSHPRPNESDELMKKDREEMAASYELLLHAADVYLRLGRSLLITATFSRKKGQADLFQMLQKHTGVNAPIIWCRPKNLTGDQVQQRLRQRPGIYRGSVTTLERYMEVKGRFDDIELPHLELDTSAPNSVDDCIRFALDYVTAERSLRPPSTQS